MPATLTKFKFAVPLWTLQFLTVASHGRAAVVRNLTGLPTYPTIAGAVMDPVLRTDTLGHWCAHFSANSLDSVFVVEAWYRTALVSASETALSNDPAYGFYRNLSGIKLVVRGLDWVAVYKFSDRPTTFIDLYRCGPLQ
jgi:hypothetical protein